VEVAVQVGRSGEIAVQDRQVGRQTIAQSFGNGCLGEDLEPRGVERGDVGTVVTVEGQEDGR
jgi:hypothetical protein